MTELTELIDKPWSCPDGQLVISADADRDAWLLARRELIGGSEFAQLIGESNYGDAFDVWAEKSGKLPPEPGTRAQRRGQLLEDAVIALWIEHDAKRPDGSAFDVVTRRAGLMRNRQHPRVGATVDRLSCCNYNPDAPSRCLVEVKTAINMSEWEGNEVPLAYQLQGVQQLVVTGRDHVHYVVLGSRFEIEHRLIRRDDELAAKMIEKIERFWTEHMLTGEPPEPTHNTQTIKRLSYKSAPKSVKFIDDELEPHVHAMLDARAQIADGEQQRDTAQAIIQLAMGEATELRWPSDDDEPGVLVATWNAGKTIDGANADFRRANRELTEPYMKPGPDVLDTEKLIENEPWLIETGQLRKRRTFSVK